MRVFRRAMATSGSGMAAWSELPDFAAVNPGYDVEPLMTIAREIALWFACAGIAALLPSPRPPNRSRVSYQAGRSTS